MSYDMEKADVGTPSSGEVASDRGRFPCPSCGSTLREGAILCPYCDADFRKPAHDGPEGSPTTDMAPIWGPPRPLTTPADRRLALLSVLIAAIALLAKIGLYFLARRAPQLLLLATVLDWGATVLAVCAILLARQAVRRIDNTRDKRGVMTAQLGLMLGWANIAYVVFSIVIWPMSQVTSNIQR
jgi:hypothetical protein